MLRPLNDYILIRPLKRESNFLIVPEEIDKIVWTVEAVGPWYYDLKTQLNVPMQIKVGEVVIFKDYMVDKLKGEYDWLVIISQNNVLAVIE